PYPFAFFAKGWDYNVVHATGPEARSRRRRLAFITCSCYRRLPFLGSARRRDLFLKIFRRDSREVQLHRCRLCGHARAFPSLDQRAQIPTAHYSPCLRVSAVRIPDSSADELSPHLISNP